MFQPRGIPVKDYGHGCLIGQLPYAMMRDDALFQRSCTSAAECGPSRLNIGWWLGAKEAAPLLLQIPDIGVGQRGKPGWHVLLRNGGDDDRRWAWLGGCGSFHAVPFLLGFA